MKNWAIFTICLLEDLEAVIFFVAGFMFAVVLVAANDFRWWYLLVAVLIGTLFNYLTDWLMQKAVGNDA